MKLSATLLAAGLFFLATADPNSRFVVHGKRGLRSPEWKRSDLRPDGRSIIPMSIALTQRNLEKGYDFLMDVSDPSSPNYGNHWKADQVAETFSASEATINSVKSWLVGSSIAENRVVLSQSRNWLHFNLTLEEAETLLQAEYSIFSHETLGTRSLACDEYSIPLHLNDHIDFITPTVKLHQRNPKVKKSNSANKAKRDIGPFNATVSPVDLSECNKYVTPACIRALYNIPHGTLNLSSYGVLALAQSLDKYDPKDLELFFQYFSPEIPQDTVPQVFNISINNSTARSFPDSETTLDLSMATALVYPQQVTLYRSANIIELFFDAVDSSYCPSSSTSLVCGSLKATSVLSVSWTEQEDPSDATQIRDCNEYMKLGLQGVTILFASGDNGVASAVGPAMCCIAPGCTEPAVPRPSNETVTINNVTYSEGNADNFLDFSGKSFAPSFPSTCPYVTSVGGTRIRAGASVYDRETAAEDDWSSPDFAHFFYSGGGFSNHYAMPDYQRQAIDSYYKHHRPNYTSLQYNNSQTARGYPDISAIGVDVAIVWKGEQQRTGGTSASTPIVGSIITLINEQRIAAGKKAVGFINPVLYANRHALNDIVSGSNPGCGTRGFEAVEGWDPVTGLGTPDYDALLGVFMALP